MIDEIKAINTSKRELRKFGVVVGLIFIGIAGFLFLREQPSSQLILTIGSALLLLGLAIPIILKPVFWLWMCISLALGWLMTRVILSILFYIVFTAISLISRLFSKRFLDLAPDHSKNSYWNCRSSNSSLDRDSYEKQF